MERERTPKRDAAMRPREVRRGNQRASNVARAGKRHTIHTWGSSLTHNISRGVLSTLWGPTPRTQAKPRPRRRLCNLS